MVSEGTKELLCACFLVMKRDRSLRENGFGTRISGHGCAGDTSVCEMATSKTAEHLAQVPLFSACSKKDLMLIAKAAEEVTIPAGKVIVEENKPGHEFFLILEGTATVRRNNRKLAELGSGQYFGELALLDRGPRTATVTADTDMTLAVLGQREFVGVLEGVPGLAYKILAIMARRLRDADTKAVSH